jgi:hypothetical protein
MSKILTAVGWLYYKYNHFPRSVRSEGFWRASNMFTMQNSGRDITDLLVLLGRCSRQSVRLSWSISVPKPDGERILWDPGCINA